MILTASDSRTKYPNAADLKEAHVRLFQSFGETSAVLLEYTEKYSEETHRGENQDEQFWEEYEQVVINKGNKPPRNRPGSYSTSVRGSVENLNVPNGFGKKKDLWKGDMAREWESRQGENDHCIRCDATDHNWRNCPIPSQPVPAFFRRAGGKSGKPALVMGTLLDPPVETANIASSDAGQSSDLPVIPDSSVDVGTDGAQAEWGTGWDFWDTADWEWMIETICFAEPYRRGIVLTDCHIGYWGKYVGDQCALGGEMG